MSGTDEPGTGDPAGTTTDPEQKPEVDWKAKAREWEKRAKANADAASKLAEIEEAQKTETQKLVDAKTAAEKAADDAKADALRWRIAAKHRISDEDADLYLTGTDEDTLERQAKGLADRQPASDPTPSKPGNFVPKEGTVTGDAKPDQLREFTRGLFGGDPNT